MQAFVDGPTLIGSFADYLVRATTGTALSVGPNRVGFCSFPLPTRGHDASLDLRLKGKGSSISRRNAVYLSRALPRSLSFSSRQIGT